MKKAIVAYIDIVGFKERIDLYFTGNAPNGWDKIRSIYFKALENAIKNYQLVQPNEEFSPSVKFFSDCLSVSMIVNENEEEHIKYVKVCLFLNMISTFQDLLFYADYLENGEDILICRGGISYNNHEEDDQVIFSKALVDAYYIEQNVSIYPRVVLDKNFLGLLVSIKSTIESLKSLPYNMEKILVKDWDENIFLNFLGMREKMLRADDNWIKFFREMDDNITKESCIQEIMNKSKTFCLNEIENQIERFKADSKDNNKFIKWLWLKNYTIWVYSQQSIGGQFEYWHYD